MKLKQWLQLPNPDGSKRRRSAFASAIGVTPTMVTQYCEDAMWPGKERMEAIVRETGGMVTPNDFISIAPDSPSILSPCDKTSESAQ